MKLVGTYTGTFVGTFVGTFTPSEGDPPEDPPCEPFAFTGLASAKPGQIYLVGEDGVPTWQPNHSTQWALQYNAFENGGAGRTAQGLREWAASFAGAGAGSTVLQSEQGWFQNPASFSTGTTATGQCSRLLSGDSAITLSATSGQWVHQATWSLDVLSEPTQRFSIDVGFHDNANPYLVQNGAYFRYRDDQNGGRLEFVTSANSVRTAVDTGIAVVAGSYYHTRVEIENNGEARGYVKVIWDASSGSPEFADDGIWTSPVATSTTNIPSGAAQPFSCGIAILKYLGTTARRVKLGAQRTWRTPPFAGNPLVAGDVGTCLRIDETGAPAWIPPHRIMSPIVFYAMGPGGFTPSGNGIDMGSEVGGTGGTGTAAGTTVDNGLLGMTTLNSGTGAANGYSFWRTAYNLNLDATVQPMVIETMVDIPTLSVAAQKFTLVTGLFDSAATAHANGITLEIDSDASATAVCRCVSGGVATQVSSGVTIVAATRYVARIVITSTQVDFYLKVDGAASFGAPVATITTNIPGLANMAAGLGVRKSVGTTSRSCRFAYCMAYQRTTTYAGSGSNALGLEVDAAIFGLSRSTSNGPYQPGEMVIMEDDNTGTPGAAPVVAFAMPTPRTNHYEINQTAHKYQWGSNDLAAFGDESGSDDTHPVCWTIGASGPPGHVGVGNAGAVGLIALSATSGVRYCDFNFRTPVASTSAEKFNSRFGWSNLLWGTALTLPLPAHGIYMEIDADTDPQMQFVCRAANVETRVDSGITIAAGTRYRGRIIITDNAQAEFYLAAEGTPLPSTPTATIATNLPSGTGQGLIANYVVEKTVGSTRRNLDVNHYLVGIDRYA